jgi:pilus assembly protein Flp/PilA
MQLRLFHLLNRLRSLIRQESGQDLVEYALVVALIALAATAGTSALGKGINNAFVSVSKVLATDV